MPTETRNLLVWRLNTELEQACWRADSLAGVKFNVVLGPCAEGLVVLPGGQVYIAAIENSEITTVDDIKDYLQQLHNTFCAIRDLSSFVAFKEGKKATAKDGPRIIKPEGFES